MEQSNSFPFTVRAQHPDGLSSIRICATLYESAHAGWAFGRHETGSTGSRDVIPGQGSATSCTIFWIISATFCIWCVVHRLSSLPAYARPAGLGVVSGLLLRILLVVRVRPPLVIGPGQAAVLRVLEVLGLVLKRAAGPGGRKTVESPLRVPSKGAVQSALPSLAHRLGPETERLRSPRRGVANLILIPDALVPTSVPSVLLPWPVPFSSPSLCLVSLYLATLYHIIAGLSRYCTFWVLKWGA